MLAAFSFPLGFFDMGRDGIEPSTSGLKVAVDALFNSRRLQPARRNSLFLRYLR
jgi:hypothetical protein